MKTLTFDFYGIVVTVASAENEVMRKLGLDFSYFLRGEADASPDVPRISITVSNEPPPFDMMPKLKASLYNSDSISYDAENIRYVDYQGDALAVYDYGNETGEIYSTDIDLLHETSYLLIHSRVGEMLDRKGLHRVHALGMTYKNKPFLCILPQGAGKTTLGLELMRDPDFKLFSDDIPLISRSGNILPFPLRIGIKGKNDFLDLNSEYIYNIRRRRHGPKTLVSMRYFKDKIAQTAPIEIIIIGEREAGAYAGIEILSAFNAVIPFMQSSVAGLGLPQIVEYFLRFGIRDIIRKFRLVLSRLRASIIVLARSRTYRFAIGMDRQKNISVLKEFLKHETEKEGR